MWHVGAALTDCCEMRTSGTREDRTEGQRSKETRVVGSKEGTMKTGNNKRDNVSINVTLRCVRVTIFFPWKSNKYYLF